MPTNLKRISISLPPELEHALNDLREATGVAPASFIVEIMTEAVPMIRSITQAATMAKQNNADAFQALGEALTEAMHQGTAVQMDLIEANRRIRKSAGKPRKRKND